MTRQRREGVNPTQEQYDCYMHLMEKAIAASQNAYCPYSKFAVGVAVLTFDDKIVTGCNIENASYTLTIHAETLALSKAVSEGLLQRANTAGLNQFQAIKALACVCPKWTAAWPCGVCRQSMAEWGLDYDVISLYKGGKLRWKQFRKLLPHAFVPNHLLNEQNLQGAVEIPPHLTVLPFATKC